MADKYKAAEFAGHACILIKKMQEAIDFGLEIGLEAGMKWVSTILLMLIATDIFHTWTLFDELYLHPIRSSYLQCQKCIIIPLVTEEN